MFKIIMIELILELNNELTADQMLCADLDDNDVIDIADLIILIEFILA